MERSLQAVCESAERRPNLHRTPVYVTWGCLSCGHKRIWSQHMKSACQVDFSLHRPPALPPLLPNNNDHISYHLPEGWERSTLTSRQTREITFHPRNKSKIWTPESVQERCLLTAPSSGAPVELQLSSKNPWRVWSPLKDKFITLEQRKGDFLIGCEVGKAGGTHGQEFTFLHLW